MSSKDNRALGIGCMLISALAFSFMSFFVKMAGDIPNIEKVFFRNSVSMIAALIMIKKAGFNNVKLFGSRSSQPLLILRSLLGVMGVILNFWAINNLILADSTMLNKISPFFVTIFAVLILKEKMSKLQPVVLVLVFLGALLIIKPKFEMSVLPALAGFISAAGAGGAYTIIRFLKDKESPATIIFYFSLFSVLFTFPIMMYQGFVMPTASQFFALVMIGVAASFGQFGVTLAYKFAPAAEVSIYNYMSIIFAALLGFFAYGEVPDVYSVIGGCIIVISAVAIFVYNNRQLKKS